MTRKPAQRSQYQKPRQQAGRGSDWAKVIGETVQETIDRVAGSPDMETGRMIREIVATEIEKVAHVYAAQLRPVQPNNIAYDLNTRANTIRKPRYQVIWTEPSGLEKWEYFDDLAEANREFHLLLQAGVPVACVVE